ncbi:hypothetical protein P7L54_10130 [Acinetobacter bereziniae]|uniref:hypothetical protein n=1 Tax=Acinetobacter bereziniae TaxID=106648 RepID=UPI001D0E6245|nr:hypothetical protein [Acinetobacter bereziniae]MDG3556308.1 hypothetical protein [Acinetobacter bereziniae]MDP6002951.1 hypothetical protein [Acinetobacter bereziniae]UUN92738.1 hypothetical protein I9189_016905 [Acinetobacter bereziniae]WMW73803.1 hypothetical protein RG306_16200 [Acinetobacter bereziniae]
MARALAQAEKGLINQLDDEKHPLLNRKLMKDQYDYIISKGNALSIIDEEIAVFSSKT